MTLILVYLILSFVSDQEVPKVTKVTYLQNKSNNVIGNATTKHLHKVGVWF